MNCTQVKHLLYQRAVGKQPKALNLPRLTPQALLTLCNITLHHSESRFIVTERISDRGESYYTLVSGCYSCSLCTIMTMIKHFKGKLKVKSEIIVVCLIILFIYLVISLMYFNWNVRGNDHMKHNSDHFSYFFKMFLTRMELLIPVLHSSMWGQAGRETKNQSFLIIFVDTRSLCGKCYHPMSAYCGLGSLR